MYLVYSMGYILLYKTQTNEQLDFIRLDFVSFSVAQPDSDGICTDAFRVAGADNNVPTICGNNNGQHSKFIHMRFLPYSFLVSGLLS